MFNNTFIHDIDKVTTIIVIKSTPITLKNLVIIGYFFTTHSFARVLLSHVTEYKMRGYILRIAERKLE